MEADWDGPEDTGPNSARLARAHPGLEEKSVVRPVGFTRPVPSPASSGISSSTSWGAWTHDCLEEVWEGRQPPSVGSHCFSLGCDSFCTGQRKQRCRHGRGTTCQQTGKTVLALKHLLGVRGGDHRLQVQKRGKWLWPRVERSRSWVWMGRWEEVTLKKEKEGLKRGNGSIHAMFWDQ